jgi:hypothetical protein
VALGSGLDTAKLTETLRQIMSSEPPYPFLLCQHEGSQHGWIHVSLSTQQAGDNPLLNPYWVLIFGYPGDNKVSNPLPNLVGSLPAGSQIVSWEGAVQATVHIPSEVSAEDIARLIQHIMLDIQRVGESAGIEVALEMM